MDVQNNMLTSVGFPREPWEHVESITMALMAALPDKENWFGGAK